MKDRITFKDMMIFMFEIGFPIIIIGILVWFMAIILGTYGG